MALSADVLKQFPHVRERVGSEQIRPFKEIASVLFDFLAPALQYIGRQKHRHEVVAALADLGSHVRKSDR